MTEINRFQLERKRKGYTQEQVAKKLNTSRSNIANWENGQNMPSIDLLFDCSELFECDAKYLAGRQEERRENNMNKNEKSDRQKTKEEILEQLYVSATDLQVLIPYLPYTTALEYIKKARDEMEEKNIFVPTGKTKIALTKIIRKNFGF